VTGLLSLTVLCLPGAAPKALAHPHVFVDTELRVFVEQGDAVAVEVTWTYDDFFSLLIFEDMGLDPDGDAELTRDELATLRGFDLEVWPEGFEGDLYAYHGGEKIELGFPEVTGIAVEDGRIVSRHVRTLPNLPAERLQLRQYDPTYYVAYTLTRPVRVEGGCRATISPHDPEKAEQAVAEELGTIPEDMFEQMLVGVHFADRVGFECPASS
jgi:ABC-type uncharacterized transport system substrate-binding protein